MRRIRARLEGAREPAAIDRGLEAIDRLGFERWRRRVVREASGRVLELGAGTGRNAHLYPDGSRPVQLDPDVESLTFARRKGRTSHLPAVCARAEELPFDDGVFDTVVATLVLCSVSDPAAAAAEVRRVLDPRGLLVGAEHMRAPGGVLGPFLDVADRVWHRLTGDCHLNRRTVPTLQGAGFAVRTDHTVWRGMVVGFRATR